MILILFSIYDTRAEIFNPPFAIPTQGQAIRDFGDLVKDPQSRISKHPDDYKLVKLGVFDDNTGVILPADQIETVSRGSDFKEVSSG